MKKKILRKWHMNFNITWFLAESEGTLTLSINSQRGYKLSMPLIKYIDTHHHLSPTVSFGSEIFEKFISGKPTWKGNIFFYKLMFHIENMK